jgi:UDP-glucose 4-epimerase
MASARLPLGRDVRTAFAGRRVLVTGGAGFIARHLTPALLDAAAELVLVGDRPSPPGYVPARGSPPLRPLSVGSEPLRQFLRSEPPFDFIFHLAGRTTATGSVHAPEIDFTSNVAATVDLLEQLRLRGGPTRFVFASSAAVYGAPARLPIDECDPAVPVSPYGLSKLVAERYIALYARLYGLSAAVVRPFSVYGPFQTKQVVYSFLRDLRRTPGELAVLGDGTQIRDLVYVTDVVRALMTVAVRGTSDGQAYNVATGRSTTIGALARLIVDMQGYSARLRFTGVSRAGDQATLVGANDRLTTIGGAPLCPLNDGLRATVDWFNACESPRSIEVDDDLRVVHGAEARPALAAAG